MRKMQLQFDASFDNQLFHFGARIFVLVIVCGGFIVGQVSAQYHGNPDHIIFPGPIGSRSRALDVKPTKGSADDSNALVNWYTFLLYCIKLQLIQIYSR